MDATGTQEPYSSVRCSATLPNGETCGSTLWRAYIGQIEIAHGVRAGKRFSLRLPLAAAQQTTISCLRCGTRWWPAELGRARRVVGNEVALAVAAARPAHEMQTIVCHNSRCHRDEAA